MYDDGKGIDEIYETLEKLFDWTSERAQDWSRLKYFGWVVRNIFSIK